MTSLRRSTLAGVAVLSLGLTACGGTDADPTPASSAPETSAAEPSSPDATEDATETASSSTTPVDGGPQVEADAVEISGFRFRPQDVVVAAGTTVTWTNVDATKHTVTAGRQDDPQPDVFDIAFDGADTTGTFTFDEPGTYRYYCELHPFMIGTVEVTG